MNETKTIRVYTMSRNKISVMEIYVYMYIYYTVYIICDNKFVDMLFYHFMTVFSLFLLKPLNIHIFISR